MKTRLIVAAIGIPVLLIVIFFLPLWVFACLAAAVCALAAWELIKCSAPEANLRLRIYAMVAAAAIAVSSAFAFYLTVYAAVLFLLVLVCFCEMIASFREELHMSFVTLVIVVMAGAVIPLLLSALVRLGPVGTRATLLLPFAIAFASDSAAYFAGMFLGQHKITPHLSPNKTMEGCVGGFLGTILVLLIFGLILKLCRFEVNFLLMAVYGFLGSLFGQIGDLSFSAVKREFGTKDYGNLLPGHGGVLDRFDSVIFVAAAVELMWMLAPAFTK